MVAEVEDLRESGARKFPLGPGAVGLLAVGEPADPPLDGPGVGSAGGHEAGDRPGGLRRRRWSNARKRRVGIALGRLAPAPIVLLVGIEPGGGPGHQRIVWRQADGPQPLECLPGSIDVMGLQLPQFRFRGQQFAF